MSIQAAFPLRSIGHASGRHIAAPPLEAAEVVQLAGTLSMGGSVRARVLRYNGAAWIDTGEEITVHDVVGSMEGTPGKRGLAWFHRQSGLWILWQLEC